MILTLLYSERPKLSFGRFGAIGVTNRSKVRSHTVGYRPMMNHGHAVYTNIHTRSHLPTPVELRKTRTTLCGISGMSASRTVPDRTRGTTGSHLSGSIVSGSYERQMRYQSTHFQLETIGIKRHMSRLMLVRYGTVPNVNITLHERNN